MTLRWLRILVGLAIASALTWLLLEDFDWRVLGAALSAASGWWLLTALLALTAGCVCRVLRWQYMLKARNPTLQALECAGPFLAGLALNNVLPLRLGDAIRVFAFGRRLNVPVGYVFGTVALERVLDLFTVATLLALGLDALPDDIVPLPLARTADWALASALLVILATLGCAPMLKRRAACFSAATSAESPPRSRLLRLHEQAGHLAGALAAIGQPRMMARLLALSALVWVCESAVVAATAIAIGVALPLPGAWFSAACGTLATLLPGAPGHIGTFDYFMALGLELFGVKTDSAIALTLLAHAVFWLPITVAGLAWLALRHGNSGYHDHHGPAADTFRGSE